MNSKLTDSGLISVPDTYQHYTDNVLFQRSFDTIESVIIMELRKEIANIREQRDNYCKLLDAAVEIMKASRLDAQRWQFFLTAQDETTPENAAFASAANALYPDNDLSKVMALAIDKVTGGKP
jgi:hypothetical protein